MSQFDSLSENFKKSLDDMVGRMSMNTEPEDIRALFARFAAGPVMTWYESLDTTSQSEVRRVMAEACSLNRDEMVVLARQAGVASPMGLLDSMLVDDYVEQPAEISQES